MLHKTPHLLHSADHHNLQHPTVRLGPSKDGSLQPADCYPAIDCVGLKPIARAGHFHDDLQLLQVKQGLHVLLFVLAAGARGIYNQGVRTGLSNSDTLMSTEVSVNALSRSSSSQ